MSLRRAGLFTLVSSASLFVGQGCLDRPIDTLSPHTTRTVSEVIPYGRVDKIDLLLAIDNSISMSDKQLILSDAVPELVRRFVNPICIGPSGPVPRDQQPAGPNDVCPMVDDGAGGTTLSKREFPPITDIHVGIISSSLGDLNSGTCAQVAHPDDAAHLLFRTLLPDGSEGVAPTYKDKGFLAWDPDNKAGGSADVEGFQDTLAQMVTGVGQNGCGYEMQLESVVRFLVDPRPYKSLSQTATSGQLAKNEKSGVDEDVLRQRADFLRPDSLVGIIMLSDENDCSVRATGQSWGVLADRMKRGSSKCETDPNDPCCYSCSATSIPAECGEKDPICSGEAEVPYKSSNLSCWHHKQRFGADFLYPTKRYVNAFQLPTIDPDSADLAPKDGAEGELNPLIAGRGANLVYFAGIVGVPWQAIARRDDSGVPSLALGYKNVRELAADGLIEKLVGDPDGHIDPTDPFMQESVEKRSGTSDVLGAAPNSVNDINGHDRTPSPDPGTMNLQYACIFDVADDSKIAPDCGECKDGDCDNPVCNGTVQTHAKALPGLRQLAVIAGLGEQGIAASVCPAQTTDKGAVDYGYSPAVGAIIDALKQNLQGYQCLPFSLNADENGENVSCRVIASKPKQDGVCSCDPGYAEVPSDVVIAQITDDPQYDPTKDCHCEIAQLAGEPRATCQTAPDDELPGDIDGWCYVDATTVPRIGNPDLVSECPANDRRIVRFVGKAVPSSDSSLHVWCSADSEQ